jgi:hypothetical protein
MKKMKMLIILAGALTVLAFSASAWAQSEDAAVDWDEAIEFADLIDTHVENGATWSTYYDEVQSVMWSQPVNASREALLAYLSGDKTTAKELGLDCVVDWPVPYDLRISPTTGQEDVYTSFTLTHSGDYLKRWGTWSQSEYSSVDNYVQGKVRNSTSYCDTYNGWVYDPSIPEWIDAADDESCYGRIVFYKVYHASTVEDWQYLNNTATQVTGHAFYACGSQRNVVLWLHVVVP